MIETIQLCWCVWVSAHVCMLVCEVYPCTLEYFIALFKKLDFMLFFIKKNGILTHSVSTIEFRSKWTWKKLYLTKNGYSCIHTRACECVYVHVSFSHTFHTKFNGIFSHSLSLAHTQWITIIVITALSYTLVIMHNETHRHRTQMLVPVVLMWLTTHHVTTMTLFRPLQFQLLVIHNEVA